MRGRPPSALRCFSLGLGLSLLLTAGCPTLGLAQPPTVPNSSRQAAPVLWQEVTCDFHKLLQLLPGWYRLQNSSMYFVIYADLASMARGLDRLAYFVEKPATKGVVVPQARLQGNVFYGHDYSLTDVARFFTALAQQSGEQESFPEERLLRERLLQAGLLRLDQRDQYTGQAQTALLGFVQAAAYPASTLPRPLDIYKHEIFHGLWFTTAYRHDVAAYWQRLPAQEQQTIIDILHQRGQYDPHDLPLIQREFAAYFRDYRGQAVLASATAQTLSIRKLEAYQHALRLIEQPYLHVLGGVPQE